MNEATLTLAEIEQLATQALSVAAARRANAMAVAASNATICAAARQTVGRKQDYCNQSRR